MRNEYVGDCIAKRKIIQRVEGRYAKRLIFLVHGWKGSSVKFSSLSEALLEDPDFENSDIFCYDYSKSGGFYSNSDPKRIAGALGDSLTFRIREGGYDSVLLVGWSMGAVLVREAVLEDFESGERRFFEKIERIALIAGTNRGFIPPRIIDKIGVWLLDLPLINRLPIFLLGRSVMRNAPFIVSLRMRWIRSFESADGSPPPTVQLLGDSDEMVSSDDSEDVFRFQNSASHTVAGSDHYNIVSVKGVQDARYRHLKYGFVENLSSLRQVNLSSSENIVFLVHGIRDYGGWTNRVNTEISRASRELDAYQCETYRYGYFNILNFMLPSVRRRQASAFVDRYVNALAMNPTAKFHFVGHSNGTYLLGDALKRFDGMVFESVYLAGSVLDSHYNWNDQFSKGSVTRLRNDCASDDVPVGFLCSFMHRISPDLGTGGVFGFFNAPSKQNGYHELKSLKGGHGEAIKAPKRATSIARWVVHSDATLTPPMNTGPGKIRQIVFRSAFFIGIAVILGVIALLSLLTLQHALMVAAVIALIAIFVILYV